VEVDVPGSEPVCGVTTFEWLLGDRYVLQRAEVGHPQAPDVVAVIAPGGDGSFLQHYYDGRGVERLYDMAFDGRTWVLERRHADFTALEFAQRFEGELSGDGGTITGRWLTSQDGAPWALDFALTYRRVSPGGPGRPS
jgi:hypothetical protein